MNHENSRIAVEEQTSIARFLSTLASREHADPEMVAQAVALRESLQLNREESELFLSVIIRTQGRRPEAFDDALLCLASQTDQNFEVFVMAHDSSEKTLSEVEAAVRSQVPSFARRVSVVPVNGGNRASPLNHAIELCRGRYIAVFDDDDLLFANWVEAFAEAEKSAKGQLLRAVTAVQTVEAESWPNLQEGFRTTSWPKAEYAKSFNQLDHLVVNHSPFMSWAFPREMFETVGMRFDDVLEVCEDWDLILQGSLLFGVHDVPHLTAIYRRWIGRESSYSVHSVQSWQASEKRVSDRIDSQSILVPPGTLEAVRRRLVRDGAAHELQQIYSSRSWRLVLRMRHILAPVRPLISRALRLARRIRGR